MPPGLPLGCSELPMVNSQRKTQKVLEPCATDNENKEREKEVKLHFVYNTVQNIQRIFPLAVRTAETITNVKAKLANELQNAWPRIETTNKDICISDGKEVLGPDFCPARRVQNGKKYVIHILPVNETFVQIKLETASDSAEVQASPGLLFVPENATVDDLHEEVARLYLQPKVSLTLCVDARGLCDSEEEDGEEANCADDERVAGYNDDSNDSHDSNDYDRNTSDAGSSSPINFEPLSLPSDAKIKNYPKMFYNGCLLMVRHSIPLTLSVEITFDASMEVSKFSLTTRRTDTLKILKQAIADKMDTDPRLLKLHENPQQTIPDCGWINGSVVKAKLLTKAAVVVLAHVDEAFEDSYFAEDTTKTTVGEMERMVEKEHRFRHNCVQLYVCDELLNSDLTLKDAGIGMDTRLTVCTKPRDSTGRSDGKKPRAKRKEHWGITYSHESECDSRLSANTSDARHLREVTRPQQNSTAAESDACCTPAKRQRNLSPGMASLDEAGEIAAVAVRNGVPRILQEDNEHPERSQSTNASSAASVSGSRESQENLVQTTGRQRCCQMQDIPSPASPPPQLLTSSPASYANHEEGTAGPQRCCMISCPQVPLASAPASFTATQEPRSTVSDETCESVKEATRSEAVFPSLTAPADSHPAAPPPEPDQPPPSLLQAPAPAPAPHGLTVASRPSLEVVPYNPAPSHRSDDISALFPSQPGSQELREHPTIQHSALEQPGTSSFVLRTVTCQQTEVRLPSDLTTEQLRAVAEIACARTAGPTPPQHTSLMPATPRQNDALDAACDLVARTIGANDWHMLSSGLGLSLKDLDDIRHEFPGDMVMQIRRGLDKWRQRVGSAATVQTLKSALIASQLVHLAEELRDDDVS